MLSTTVAATTICSTDWSDWLILSSMDRYWSIEAVCDTDEAAKMTVWSLRNDYVTLARDKRLHEVLTCHLRSGHETSWAATQRHSRPLETSPSSKQDDHVGRICSFAYVMMGSCFRHADAAVVVLIIFPIDQSKEHNNNYTTSSPPITDLPSNQHYHNEVEHYLPQ